MTPKLAHAGLCLFLVAACIRGPTASRYQVHTLSSGEQVKVLGVNQMAFAQSGPALMLRYETDLDVSDTAALHREAERIWTEFRSEAERAGVQSAVLSANSPPTGGGIVRHSKGYNFVYLKEADGSWRARR